MEKKDIIPDEDDSSKRRRCSPHQKEKLIVGNQKEKQIIPKLGSAESGTVVGMGRSAGILESI